MHNCYDITRFSVEFERPIFFSVSPQECILNQKVVLIITLAFFVISSNVSNSLLFSTAIFTVLNSFLASAVGLRIRQLTAILPNQKHFPNICVIFKSFSALMRALIIYLRTVVNVVFSLSLSFARERAALPLPVENRMQTFCMCAFGVEWKMANFWPENSQMNAVNNFKTVLTLYKITHAKCMSHTSNHNKMSCSECDDKMHGARNANERDASI